MRVGGSLKVSNSQRAVPRQRWTDAGTAHDRWPAKAPGTPLVELQSLVSSTSYASRGHRHWHRHSTVCTRSWRCVEKAPGLPLSRSIAISPGPAASMWRSRRPDLVWRRGWWSPAFAICLAGRTVLVGELGLGGSCGRSARLGAASAGGPPAWAFAVPWSPAAGGLGESAAELGWKLLEAGHCGGGLWWPPGVDPAADPKATIRNRLKTQSRRRLSLGRWFSGQSVASMSCSKPIRIALPQNSRRGEKKHVRSIGVAPFPQQGAQV